MNIGGRIAIDLTGDPKKIQRKVWQAIDAPPGAEVVFIVEPHTSAIPSDFYDLRERGKHLGRVTVQCDDAPTVTRYVAAIRGQDFLL